MKQLYAGLVAKVTGMKEAHVWNALKLFDEGGTVPFIARYRKEMTGVMDEESLIKVRDLAEKMMELDKRREKVICSIEEQGAMTEPLREAIMRCTLMSELEDLYLPFRPKRKTRAEIARKRGLLPLARTIMDQGLIHLMPEASRFVNPEKEVFTPEEALAGARDIIAEWVNENAVCRKRVRILFEEEGIVRSRIVKGKEKDGEKYMDYFSWEEPLKKVPSHRYLAMMRGEEEGFLRIEIRPSAEAAIAALEGVYVKNDYDTGHQVALAVEDAYKRLMAPSMETEMRSMAKQNADEKAIAVFVSNVRQLLMASPLGARNVLAIDPGFRTGCKVVCIDKTGNLLHNATVYPHPPQNEKVVAMKKIGSLVSQYKIEAIAIGNGTGGRETEDLIKRIKFDREVIAIMVNESGASVYSASKIARDEFPDYDITVRGAVSIGRRLQDPLAELVKIDPKSIGVGQYQHDVDQKALEKSLVDTVVSCVNQVGVDVNMASVPLLTNVSGVGPQLAENIVSYRKEMGPFGCREDLKKVPRLGPRAFEQAAGFLRIRGGSNPLDNTAVHPESYGVVQAMAQSLQLSVGDMLKNTGDRQTLDPANFITGRFGLPTIRDILKELDKPGRDPRLKFEVFEFEKGIHKIQDLIPGMVLNGIVTNITAFGAFVDLGVHQDGLIHISQVADAFVSDINAFLHLNQKVRVKVLQVEPERKRIQLTLKGIDPDND